MKAHFHKGEVIMKKCAYVWLALLLALGLAACAGVSGGQKSAENGVGAAAEQTPETPQSSEAEQTPEAAQATEAEQAPEAAEASETEQTPEAAQPIEPEQAPETAEARDLTEDELRQWSEFLSQSDCYGFLMSSYETPLDANLGQVFYNGAGVGEYPTEEMIADFLEETGLEEVYTDITFVPYDAANQVLQRRTGYTLEHFKLAGNDIPMTYLPKYAGYFQMAGDTNRIIVECVSGRKNADGSITLESREKSWADEPDDDNDFVSTFETTLRPDAQGRGMVFDSNAVTGGWLTWTFDEDEME